MSQRWIRYNETLKYWERSVDGVNFSPVIEGWQHHCRAYRTTNQTIPNTTDVFIDFDNERLDSTGMHVVSGATNRITILEPGLYLVGAQVRWASNTGGTFRALRLKTSNGDVIAVVSFSPLNSVTDQIVTTMWKFALNEWVTVEVAQNSGGNLDIVSQASFSPEFWAVRLGA